MTEIQEAFEKWAVKEHGPRYSLSPWDESWVQREEIKRTYSNSLTESDFRIFSAGWEARGKV